MYIQSVLNSSICSPRQHQAAPDSTGQRNKTDVEKLLSIARDKIAKELTSYGVKVRYVTLPPDKDVGDMELGEFEDVSLSAKTWHSNHRLFSKIGEIRSGSLI